MLKIVIPGRELFDEEKNEFIEIKTQKLALEHSLVSISKWEAKWKVPFLGHEEKTLEQSIDYIRCMTLTQNVDPRIYYCITKQNVDDVSNYINDSMTATWFSNQRKGGGREVITSEIIYYWMVALNIPFECQKWHLNRLLTLIQVCNEKNAPAKRMSKREIMNRNRSLNAARRARLNTKG